MAAITTLDATPPIEARLAAVAEVQRLDVEAMHEKVRGILATIPFTRMRESSHRRSAARVLSALGPRIFAFFAFKRPY